MADHTDHGTRTSIRRDRRWPGTSCRVFDVRWDTEPGWVTWSFERPTLSLLRGEIGGQGELRSQPDAPSPGINALAASIYPTGLRATGVGWCLGIGRAGSIAGPVIAAQLIARHWSSEQMLLMAAVPAALSSLMVWGMAQMARPRPSSAIARKIE